MPAGRLFAVPAKELQRPGRCQEARGVERPFLAAGPLGVLPATDFLFLAAPEPAQPHETHCSELIVYRLTAVDKNRIV